MFWFRIVAALLYLPKNAGSAGIGYPLDYRGRRLTTLNNRLDLNRSMMTRFRIATALLLVVPLLLSACDLFGDDDDPDIARATFRATVSGDLDDDLSGEAFYTVADSAVAEDPRGAFYLFFLDVSNSDTSLAAIARPGMDIPGEGNHEIGSFFQASQNPETFEGFVALYASQDVEAALASSSGELNISNAEEDLLEGTFSFAAEELFTFGGSEPIDAEVEGTFSAEFRDIEDLEDILEPIDEPTAASKAGPLSSILR